MTTRWISSPMPASWKRGALVAVVAPVLVSLLAVASNNPPTAVVSVLYVLAVVVAARVGGALAGIGASILSFVALNFFFTRPVHTLAVGSASDVVALLVFLVTSLIVGVLLSVAMSARARAERSEMEARLLNHLATKLLSGETTEDVLASFTAEVCDVFDVAGCEITTAYGRAASAGARVPQESPEEVRLVVRRDDIGVMRLWPGSRGRLTGDERRALDSLAPQVALALEAQRLAIEVARAELEAHANRLKADLFSGVTHNVKTPLAVITTSVTSLLDGGDFSERDRRDHLETIRQEADRLHRVVNNLIDVARVRAGALAPAKAQHPIDELMESVLNRLRLLLKDRHVEISVGDDVPEVLMDVVQMDQVLTNLIENAVKFSPPASPITLRAVGAPDRVRVTVSDRGPGILRQDRQRIFRPFERGKEAGPGTGLGLAVSNAIVAAHGGRMWVSEAPGGGAAFTFELPRVEGSGVEVTDAGASARR